MEYPPQRGGVGNYYAGLVKAMSPAKQIEVEVLAADTRWWKVMVKMILDRSDIVWVGHILPIGTAAWLCNVLFKKKYIVSLHGMDINLAQKHKPNLTTKILKRAHLITVNSEYTKQQIHNWQELSRKIEIVYPCPNIDKLRPKVNISY